MSHRISNPVLKGFNPDPSIIRVGDDYFIATSTFEWFPGVQISHSTDLEHWRVVARPLNRTSQLDMRGAPNSAGVWAPCLSYCDGLFHLIFTDVKRWAGDYKDAHNYLVTATDIAGPWSEPVYLNSSGFDPSLFHDDDGRKWFVNMLWDHRPLHQSFAGILLQEYDPRRQQLVGDAINIFKGSNLGLVEGPHLYKNNGYYFLLTAEGGTFTTHAATVARARHIEGPYEIMPGNPLLTSAHAPHLKLQSAGHGCLVENADGSWLLAHLCRRPLPGGRSILGRETAIQNIEWVDDWPRLTAGGNQPREQFSAPTERQQIHSPEECFYDFSEPELSIDWQSPRIPVSRLTSLTARAGYLRLYGKESIQSQYEQALLARRQQDFHIRARTLLQYSPSNFQQMAGLVAFYNTDAFYYLYITHADHSRRCLGAIKCEKGAIQYLIEKEYPLDDWEDIYLGLTIKDAKIRFEYSPDGTAWHAAGWEYDASILADEQALPCGFTGNFIGIACQDLTGTKQHADFKWFEYRRLGL